MKTEYWNGCPIRFVEKESEWWAVAKDVAEALGYQLATNMTRLLDKKDKGTQKVNTLGGTQDLLVISEFGIYDAVFSSHKPEAKDFAFTTDCPLIAARGNPLIFTHGKTSFLLYSAVQRLYK